MPTLQQNIAKKFLDTLIEGKKLDSSHLDQIQKLLAKGQKPKAEDFVKIFTTPVGGEIK